MLPVKYGFGFYFGSRVVYVNIWEVAEIGDEFLGILSGGTNIDNFLFENLNIDILDLTFEI